jgi:uncharacterized protein YggU (UPF0235/DUF167 family)
LRVTIRVKPSASVAKVGGSYGDRQLVVAVTERPDGGRATEAALRAVADAFEVSRSNVRLLYGATARTKLLDVPGDNSALTKRLDALLNG